MPENKTAINQVDCLLVNTEDLRRYWVSVICNARFMSGGYKIVNWSTREDTMKNCEFFYDPTRAIYDSGADYLTREKHRLVVIANSAWGLLLNLSCYYDEILEKRKIPFGKQEIDDDMDKVSALKRKFKDISEIKVGDDWEYPFNYEQGMKELDEVLLKYIPFFEEEQ